MPTEKAQTHCIPIDIAYSTNESKMYLKTTLKFSL